MCRNHVLFSFVFRFINLCVFVFVWTNPIPVMITCSISQLFYTLYFSLAAKYKKRRYAAVNAISNLLFPIQVVIAGFANITFNHTTGPAP